MEDSQPAKANPRAQVAEKLKTANNVLVTVSVDPSVDQLAALIALTLMLNKTGKHGTAVFSGAVPSTIEFLQPEKTIEKTTDSLRDFIIALDKSKADKLRYKVEDKVVKIFITPYRTTISEKDLEFSQGDFNIDAVIALGVDNQSDLDRAITAHGRILHDATVIAINREPAGQAGLGSINWQDDSVSSLCELVVQIGDELGNNLLDAQIATALLTGIVAETDRFANARTSPMTMSVSSRLISAGANPQLVATKLEKPAPVPPPSPPPPKPAPVPPPPPPTKPKTDGIIEIKHRNKPVQTGPVEDSGQIKIDEEGNLQKAEVTPGPNLVTEPPVLGGTLTANSRPNELEPSTDPLSLPPVEPPLLGNETTAAARDKVADAAAAAPMTGPLPPISALNAQPVFDNLQSHPKIQLHTPLMPAPGFGATVSDGTADDADKDQEKPSGAPSFSGFAPPPVPPPLYSPPEESDSQGAL